MVECCDMKSSPRMISDQRLGRTESFIFRYHYPSGFMSIVHCFNQTGGISTLNGSSLKIVDKFANLGSSLVNRGRHRHGPSKDMDSYR